MYIVYMLESFKKLIFVIILVLGFGNSQSLSFDGTNDYVALTRMNFNNSDGFTLSLWVKKKTGLPSGNNYESIIRQDLNGNPDLMLQFAKDDKLALGINSASAAYDEIVVDISSSDYIDTWVHIAVRYDPGTAYLYVNGSQVGSENSHSGVAKKVHILVSMTGIRTPDPQNGWKC